MRPCRLTLTAIKKPPTDGRVHRPYFSEIPIQAWQSFLPQWKISWNWQYAQECLGQGSSLSVYVEVATSMINRNQVCALFVLCLSQCFVSAQGTSEEAIMASARKVVKKDGEITRIDLSLCPITDAFMPNLKSLDKLLSLDLSTTKVTSNGLKQIAKLHELRELAIGSSKIDGKGLESIRALKKMEFLDVAGLVVRDEDLTGLEFPNLHHLNLTGTWIKGDGLKFLEKSPNLVTLMLGYTDINDSALAHVKNLQKLRRLELTETKVTGMGLEKVVKGMHLEYLVLMNNEQLKSKDIAFIRSMPHLIELNLRATSINDEALAHFVGLEKLETLDLSRTDVSDAGLAVLGQMSHLRYINLIATKVTRKGVEELSKNLSKNKVRVQFSDPE